MTVKTHEINYFSVDLVTQFVEELSRSWKKRGKKEREKRRKRRGKKGKKGRKKKKKTVQRSVIFISFFIDD